MIASSNRKTYILDTSVLLADPAALYAFEEHKVVISVVVLKELENLRSHQDVGFNARAVLRDLEDLRTADGGDLRAGVLVNDLGGTVRIEINHIDTAGLPATVAADRGNDARILAVAKALRDEGEDAIVVSRDLPMRLFADGVLGIPAQDYRRDQVVYQPDSGLREVEVADDLMKQLYATGAIPADGMDIPVNSGLVVTAGKSSALAVLSADKQIVLVRADSLQAFGVTGRSAEQRIALAHLLNPDIPLVSLSGAAGTGKTLLALASALELVLEKQTMKRIMVFRPLHAVGGETLGYLPGDSEEKMNPWAAAIFDALRAITTDDVIAELKARNLLEVLPLTHIRGRTLGPGVIALVDEAQNLELPTILAAITRLGEDSKMVLLHDVAQIDNRFVSRHDGIAAAVARLVGEPLFAHTCLVRSERSAVAAMAARLLDGGGREA
ncbi:MAG TPA: ribonuclease [Actinobacteria bacterium]|nr:ribonuclease [Actinomycetota bacterium]